jgi:hypothetical protein
VDAAVPRRVVAEQMTRILGLRAAMFPGTAGGWGQWAAGVVFEDWDGLRDRVASGIRGYAAEGTQARDAVRSGRRGAGPRWANRVRACPQPRNPAAGVQASAASSWSRDPPPAPAAPAQLVRRHPTAARQLEVVRAAA